MKNENIIAIGLMGQLASGKSTVASYFNEFGIDVISADVVAKDLTAPSKPAYDEIIKHLGTSLVTKNGELDRRRLRTLIFNDPSKRLWLERLLHPLIRKEIEHRMTLMQSAYVIIEIPLLHDRESYPYLKRVLLVEANPEEQISRCMRRDNQTRDETLAILAAQVNIEKQRTLADDVLVNNGSLDELKKKVSNLHNQYLTQ